MSTSEPRDRPEAQDASALRRLGGFVVDWVISSLVTFLLLPYDLALDPGEQPPMLLGVPESSWATVGVFFALNVVLVSLLGSTVGHRVFGLQVWQVRPWPFPVQVVVRSALVSLVLPAIIPTGDGRRLHDWLAGTRIVRPTPPAA